MKNTKNKYPLFSVIIPTYNSSEFIGESLASVINQSFNNYEVIISDDGSEDKTIKIVKNIIENYPHKTIKLIVNDHQGPGHARNQAILNAEGEWVAFLDSDDRWRENKLYEVERYIDKHPSKNVISNSKLCVGNGKKYEFEPHKYFDKSGAFLSLLRQNPLITSGLTLKKEFLLKTSLFDNSLLSAQDYDLWLRLAVLNEFNIGFIKKNLGYYNIRNGSITSNFNERLRCLLVIGEKYKKEIKNHTSFAQIEYLKYKSKAYTDVCILCFDNKQYLKGLILLIIGFSIWPFSVDLFKKVFKKIMSRLGTKKLMNIESNV